MQGFQFTGLPLISTFKPIRIINVIIQHTNKNNKELWIFALDMSKAYNRINNFMLKKAFRQIKIPEEAIELIISIFLDRN